MRPGLGQSRSPTRKRLHGAGGLQCLAEMIATDPASPAQETWAAPGRRPLTCGGRIMRGASCLAATLLAGLSFGPLATRGLAGGGTEPVTRLGTHGTRFTVSSWRVSTPTTSRRRTGPSHEFAETVLR